MQRIFALFALAAVTLLTGCQTTFLMSEADLFFRHHPELRTSYTRLCPTDVELLKEQAFSRESTRREAAEFVRQNVRVDDKLKSRLEERRRWDETLYAEEMGVIRALEAALQNHGGQVYFFEREQPLGGVRNLVISEQGYVILSAGEIKSTAGLVRGTRAVRGGESE